MNPRFWVVEFPFRRFRKRCCCLLQAMAYQLPFLRSARTDTLTLFVVSQMDQETSVLQTGQFHVFKYLSQRWISQRKHRLCFANLQFREPDPVLIGPNHCCKTSILFTLRLHRIDLPCMWCLPHIRLCQTGMSAALHD